MHLEVLEHLAQFLGTWKQAVKDLWRGPYLDVVSERIEPRHEVVARVRTAARPELSFDFVLCPQS